jgi:hypothetical protein
MAGSNSRPRPELSRANTGFGQTKSHTKERLINNEAYLNTNFWLTKNYYAVYKNTLHDFAVSASLD